MTTLISALFVSINEVFICFRIYKFVKFF